MGMVSVPGLSSHSSLYPERLPKKRKYLMTDSDNVTKSGPTSGTVLLRPE